MLLEPGGVHKGGMAVLTGVGLDPHVGLEVAAQFVLSPEPGLFDCHSYNAVAPFSIPRAKISNFSFLNLHSQKPRKKNQVIKIPLKGF